MKKNKNKNVLLITPFAPPNIGGAETHLEDFYEYLRSDGSYNVTLLTYQPLTTKDAMGMDYEKRKNLSIYRYKWFGTNLFHTFEKYPPVFNFLYLTPYLMFRSIIFMIKNHQSIDIIHCFGLNAAFISRILKLLFKKKIYMSAEALYDFDINTLFGRIVRWVLLGFEVILAGSEDSKNDILKLNIPMEKVVIYTHWINTGDFHPGNKDENKKLLGWDDKFTIIYVGRLIPSKGIRMFIDIAKAADENINFKVIGDGPEKDFVSRAANKISNLEFIGQVSNDEIAKYYVAADLLLYPALYHEDLSLVLLESMASGTPVISTNIGSGIYMLNSKVASVVEASQEKINNEVDRLYKNRKLVEQMSNEAVIFARKFGPSLAKIITDTYE